MKVIQELRQRHSLKLLLQIAQLPRSTFYYYVKHQKGDKYAKEKEEITRIFHENKGRYGYRRVTTALRNSGFTLNHKTVQRLMKEMGLVCRVRMKKYRSYKGEQGTVAPNLLNREFTAEKPNQKWVTDVTELDVPTQSSLIWVRSLYRRTATISIIPKHKLKAIYTAKCKKP